MQDHIFKPLGMSNTTFFPFDGEQASRLMPLRWWNDKEQRFEELTMQFPGLTLPRVCALSSIPPCPNPDALAQYRRHRVRRGRRRNLLDCCGLLKASASPPKEPPVAQRDGPPEARDARDTVSADAPARGANWLKQQGWPGIPRTGCWRLGLEHRDVLVSQGRPARWLGETDWVGGLARCWRRRVLY